MFKGKFPDITPAQVIAALLAAVPQILILLGIDLDEDQRDALNNLLLVGLGLFGADAAIRIGRNVGGKKAEEEDDPEDLEDLPDEVPPEADLKSEFPEEAPVDAPPEGAVGGKPGEQA